MRESLMIHRDSWISENGNGDFRKKDFIEWSKGLGYSKPQAQYLLNKHANRVSHGLYNFTGTGNIVPMNKAETKDEDVSEVKTEMKPIVKKVRSTLPDEVFIPAKVKEFVKWGYFNDVKKIIESKMFFPMYIAGLSGNGKTFMVEQACAEAKREYVRVQITPETDEDDLIGGFRLLDGETVFAKGPVIRAMEAGAILLIDEIDRGSNKLMALQGVLEGKPVLIKKTGEIIEPAEGFNIIATANTKGQGDESGRFISAGIIDEAFLERFNVTLEQPYPSNSIEKKIVLNHMEKFECLDEEFAVKLVKWGQAIRKTYEDGGVDDMISTRRICHIVQTFSIFEDRMKAIELCVNRFDGDTRAAFVDLYTKIDAEAIVEEDSANTSTVEIKPADENDIPF